MTVIAFKPRARSSSSERHPCDTTPIVGRFRSPRGRVGTMVGSLRLTRLVIAPRGAFVSGIFTGELREPDGTLIGVDTRRATVPAELVRDEQGLRPVVRGLKLDLMGMTIDVDAFVIDPCLAFPRGQGSRRGRPAAARDVGRR
ncbi:hypothetical protein [Phycicoccus sp. Root563]|uniref:hypothetical protein n=1 Tax=Phycicoccus sp. Root563 TaxID=1736562 RepID=UPI000AE96103|nr:hypothetical protein [Phycicoccus sp. Root563]